MSEPRSVAGWQSYTVRTGLTLGARFAAYSQIYRRQPNIGTLIDKLAYSHARTPLRVYRTQADGDRQDVTVTEPYGQLLNNPNRRHSAFFFQQWISSTFDLYGEAIVLKVRPGPGQPPTELWPMHPARVHVQRDEEGNLWYIVMGSVSSGGDWQAILAIPESDVIHFKGYNPDDTVRGLSRLESLRADLESQDAMKDASANFWKKGARPGAVLTTPGKLSGAAMNRLKADWENLHGGAGQWGGTAILEEGVKPTILPLNLEELAYIDSRKLSREECCMRYDVPPPVVHILDKATFSNIVEQMRSMYRDTMAPRFGLFEGDWNTQLAPDFDATGELTAVYYMDDLLRGDFETRVDSYQTAIQSGQMTPAEVRREENRPDLGEATHQLYGNAALVPLGSVNPGLAPAASEGTAPVRNPDSSLTGPGRPKKAVNPMRRTMLAIVPEIIAPEIIDGEIVNRCASCAVQLKEGQRLSRRGWCRGCEGRASRQTRKAIQA